MRKEKKIRIAGLLTGVLLVLAACGSGGVAAENQSAEVPSAEIQAAESTDNTTSNANAPVDAESEKQGGVDSTAETDTSVTNEVIADDAAQTDNQTDTLVLYFSRTGEQYGVGVIDEGNTAIVAKLIAEKTGADLFEILPEEDYYPYTYKELTDIAKREQNENARPAYAGEAPDLSGYTTLFIGERAIIGASQGKAA